VLIGAREHWKIRKSTKSFISHPTLTVQCISSLGTDQEIETLKQNPLLNGSEVMLLNLFTNQYLEVD
jgi:hypothetical protein